MICACVLAALGSVFGLGLAAELLRDRQGSSLDKQLQGLGERAHLIVFPWLLALGWVYLEAFDTFMYDGAQKNWTCDCLVWYCLLTPVLTALSVSGQVLWLKGVTERRLEEGRMGRMLGISPQPWGIVSNVAQDVQQTIDAAQHQSNIFLAQPSVRLTLMAAQIGATVFGTYLLRQPDAGTCNLGIWWAALALTTCTATILLVVVVTVLSVMLIHRLIDDCVGAKEEWEFVIDSLFVDQEDIMEEAERSGLKLPSKGGAGPLARERAFPVEVVTTSGM